MVVNNILLPCMAEKNIPGFGLDLSKHVCVCVRVSVNCIYACFCVSASTASVSPIVCRPRNLLEETFQVQHRSEQYAILGSIRRPD